jgi:hypothetical protein
MTLTRKNFLKSCVTPHKLLLCALAYIALAGCATTHYATVYCLSHDQQLPAEPPKIKDKLTGDAATDVGTLAGSAIRLRAWGEGLQTILEGCREPQH